MQIATLRWYQANLRFHDTAVDSSPWGLAFDGANIWVANYGSHNVNKLRPSDGSVMGTYTVGNWPIAIAFDGANIWVVNNSSNNVMKLDPNTGAVLVTSPVGSNPWELPLTAPISG